jgi:DNA-binding IclR family transcriptional regulator
MGLAMGRKRLRVSEEGPAGSTPDGAEDRHFVGALARGLEVLACFRKGETMLGNQEIAARCNLPKSTVSRLTYTLTKLGYLHYIESVAKYRLGTAILALGTTMLARLDVRNFAKPLMEELSATVRTSMALATRDRLSMIYVECVRGPAAISLNVDVGSRIKIWTSAIGRAFLAACTEEERAPILDEMRALDPLKWPKIRDTIAKSIADHHTLGCTRSFGEWNEAVNAIAVGFRPGGGLPPMAINCAGPAMVTKPEFLLDEVRPHLIAVCRRLEGSMGSLQMQYCDFSRQAPEPATRRVEPIGVLR